MLELVSDSARFVHVAFGAVGLAAFWFPVVARKGGPLHMRAGRVFKWCAYVVLAAAAAALSVRVTSLALEGITPFNNPGPFGFIVFLGYLTVVTFVVVRHGVTVLQHKRDHATMRHPLNYALAWAAIAASSFIVGYALLLSPDTKILLIALSPIGFLAGRDILRFLAEEPASSRAWFYEHMSAMLGGGIAFHTAFLVFGSTRLFDLGLNGWVAVLPWIAPAAIGVPASIVWTNHYRRKFGEVA